MNIKINLSVTEIESKIIDYLNFNDVLISGTLVSITYYYYINQIYVRINTSELTEYYNQIITEVNQFYIYSKGISRVIYFILLPLSNV